MTKTNPHWFYVGKTKDGKPIYEKNHQRINTQIKKEKIKLKNHEK